MDKQDQADPVASSRPVPHHSLPEMSLTQFGAWRHRAETEAYLQFLADRRADLRQEALERLENGTLDDRTRDELSGRLSELNGLIELRLEEMRAFYGLDKEDQDQGS